MATDLERFVGADGRGSREGRPPTHRRRGDHVRLLPVPLRHRPHHGQGRPGAALGDDREGLPARVRRDGEPLHRPPRQLHRYGRRPPSWSEFRAGDLPAAPWDAKVARVWCTCFRNREERKDFGVPLLRLPRDLKRMQAAFEKATGLHLRAGTDEMMWLGLNEDGTPAVTGKTKPYCYRIDQFAELQPVMQVIEYGQAMGLDMIQGDRGMPRPDRAQLRLRPAGANGRQPLDVPADLQGRRPRARCVSVLHAEALHGSLGERLPPQHLALEGRRERLHAGDGRPAEAERGRPVRDPEASSSTLAR